MVVGAGPNGLAAGITLARAGVSTRIYESSDTIGGGCRSSELTLPGFIHDVCSAIHPLAASSPFFNSLPLEQYGVKWVMPQIALANPFEDGSVALIYNSLERTANRFEKGSDRERYASLFSANIENLDAIVKDVLGPLTRLPRRPLQLLSFLSNAVFPVRSYAKRTFQGRDVRAIFAGMAAHSMLALDRSLTTGFAILLLLLAHTVGWPFPEGGAQKISDALAGYFRSLGGEIDAGFEVRSKEELPKSTAYLFDLTPRQILKIFGESAFPSPFSNALKSFKYGPGVFKLDYALDGPIPWKSEDCLRAGTVHVCGELEDVERSEQAVWDGELAERPFVIVAQQSLFDRSRTPNGKHTAWAYCHVPHGSDADMKCRVEAQIERFAPGFRRRILASHSFTAVEMEHYNANYVGGDINGGLQDFWQTIARPSLSISPYSTPLAGVYICSSSTPPGGGVHGMCGYFAARAAISKEFSR